MSVGILTQAQNHAIVKLKREICCGVWAVSKVWKILKAYWPREETNIFRNYIDAILGLIILIALPCASICSAIFVEKTTFANYVFPIVSICLSGACDTYGRFQKDSHKNFKLVVRLVLEMFSSRTSTP